MNRPVPRHNVNLTAEELELVLRGALGQGDHEGGRERFEADAARYFGVPHAIAVESGRTALHLALEGLDLPEGATVVLPSYCFFSLVKVVEGMGFIPRFAPVDPNSFALCPARLADHLEGAHAVIVIQPFGQVADMESLQSITALLNIPLVEDASQSTGARWGRHPVGSIGDVGVFSLVSGKNLQTFGGGLILTHRADVARGISVRMSGATAHTGDHAAQAFRAGLQRWFLTTPVGYRTVMHPISRLLSWVAPSVLEGMLYEERARYDPDRRLYRLSDAQGALGCLELAELDRRNATRRANALRLIDGLRGIHGLHLPQFDARCENSFNAVAVRCARADELTGALQKDGFDVRSDYMEWLGPAADFDEPVIYLPNHPGMSTADIDRLVSSVRSALK